jgi:hypothetical protein
MNGLRMTLGAGVALAIACASLPAHADEEQGLAIGFRTGVGFAMGKAFTTTAGDTSLATFEGGQWPFWFDLGWRFNKNWYGGLWYQFGITHPPNSSCASCDGNDQRFGINAHYHIQPTELVDPWVGLGVGYEVARRNAGNSITQGETSLIAHGLQFVDLQVGADLRFSKQVPFGPFLDFSLGSFSGGSAKDVNGVSTDIPGFSGGVHEWLELGARAQFNL